MAKPNHGVPLFLFAACLFIRPAAATCTLDNFKIYSKTGTKISSGIQVVGNVGSNATVEVASNGAVAGNVTAVGALILRLQSYINGNVTYGTTLTRESGVTVTGSTTKGASPTCAINTISLTAGSSDKTISAGQTLVLNPGSYRNVIVRGGGTLIIRTGTYTSAIFQLDASSRLQVDPSNGLVQVRATSKLAIGSGVVMTSSGAAGTVPVKFHTNQTTQLLIGGNSLVQGTITAPNVEIRVSAGTSIQGRLYGNKVTLDAGSRLGGMPAHVRSDGFDDDLYKSDGNNVTDVFSTADFRQAAYSLLEGSAESAPVHGTWESFVNRARIFTSALTENGGVPILIAKEQFVSYESGLAPAARTFFMAAPALTRVSGWDVTFVANPALNLTSDPVQSIEIQIDGTTLTLGPGGTAYYGLAHSGEQVAMATVRFASGFVGRSMMKFTMETLPDGGTYR